MNNSIIVTLDFYHSSFYVKVGTTEHVWTDPDIFVADTEFPYRDLVRSVSFEPTRNLYITEYVSNEIVSGDNNEVMFWIANNLNILEEKALSYVTAVAKITVEMVRFEKLVTTDWIIQRHQEETLLGIPNTLTNEEFIAILTYRQELRDLTDTYAKDLSHDQAVWPVYPLTH